MALGQPFSLASQGPVRPPWRRWSPPAAGRRRPLESWRAPIDNRARLSLAVFSFRLTDEKKRAAGGAATVWRYNWSECMKQERRDGFELQACMRVLSARERERRRGRAATVWHCVVISHRDEVIRVSDCVERLGAALAVRQVLTARQEAAAHSHGRSRTARSSKTQRKDHGEPQQRPGEGR